MKLATNDALWGLFKICEAGNKIQIYTSLFRGVNFRPNGVIEKSGTRGLAVLTLICTGVDLFGSPFT